MISSTSPHQIGTSSALIRMSDVTSRLRSGLTTGHKQAGYQDERTMLFAVSLWALGHGHSLTDLITSFMHGSLTCDHIERERVSGGWPRVVKLLRRCWEDAERRLDCGDPYAITLELVETLDALDRLPLPGRGGAAERAVLWAVVTAGLDQRTRAPRLSRAEMMVATGMTEEPWDDATRRLLSKGHLLLAEPGSSRGRTRWQISETVNRGCPATASWPEGGTPGLVVSPCHDLWHHGKSGLHHWELARYLTHVGAGSATALAAALGRNVQTLRQHLNWLAEHDLACRDDDGQWHGSVTAEALDTAATKLDVHGAGRLHEELILGRAAARTPWVIQREMAVEDLRAAQQLKKEYEASSVQLLPNGWMHFCVVDAYVDFSVAAYRERGRPTSYLDMLGPVAPIAGVAEVSEASPCVEQRTGAQHPSDAAMAESIQTQIAAVYEAELLQDYESSA